MTRRDTNLRFPGGQKAPYAVIRSYILRRDPTCRICAEAPASEVDHIWPRHYGGNDWSNNLQGVCPTCNKRKGNTVDPERGTTGELTHAIAAITSRAHDLVYDLRRFNTELIVRALGDTAHDQTEAFEQLKIAAQLVWDAADFLNGSSAVLSEYRDTITDRLPKEVDA